MITKDLVTGNDIDLSQYNLGVLKQPTVKDFMSEFDVLDFIKPFYVERMWKVNGIITNKKTSFTLFCLLMSQDNSLEEPFIKALEILYPNYEIRFYADDEMGVIFYENDKPVAFINDENFDKLCEIVTKICYFSEPKKQVKEEEIDGNAEDIALMKKYEDEFNKKHKNKNVIYFEEKVREVIHIKNCFYKDVENLTIWQIEDIYKTHIYMNNEKINYQFASSGNFKINLKNQKSWQSLTMLSRD